jgi:hypothetical protein
MMCVTVSGRQPCAVVQSTSSPTKSHKTHNDRCSGEWQEHHGRWLVVVVGHGLLGCALQQLFSCRHRCRRCCAWMGRLLHTIQSRTNKRCRKGSTTVRIGCGGSWIIPHLFGGWNTRKGHERDGGMFRYVTRPQ